MPRKEVALKHASVLSAYLLIVWGFYRFLVFEFPEEIEEFIIKPIVWLVPVIILLRKEKLGASSIGITFKNLFPALYLSVGLGVIFAVEGIIINIVKYGGLHFTANLGQSAFYSAVFITFATAISEEVAFRGYLFTRVWHSLNNVWVANVITSIIWALVHVPITIFEWKLHFESMILFLILTTVFGIGSAFVFAKTRNVLSSVFLHFLWQWPIILFR